MLIHTLKSLLVSLSELLGGLILSSGSNQVLLRTWLFVGSLGLRFLTPRVMFKEVVEVQRNDSRWLKICILLLSCNAFNTKLCVRIMIWVLIHSTIDFIHNFLLHPTVLVLQIFRISSFSVFLFIFFVKYSHVCLQSQLTESRYIKQRVTFYKIFSNNPCFQSK